MPMLARITTSVRTIRISIIVKPLASCRQLRDHEPAKASLIPVAVLGAIECGALVLGVNVKNVLAIPRRRIRFVLIPAQSPLVIPRRWIDRNAAEEFQLAARGIVGD